MSEVRSVENVTPPRLTQEQLQDAWKYLEQDGSGPIEGHIAALESELEQARRTRLADSMLAHKWMVAHDCLQAGIEYEFPAPADLPDALAQLAQAEGRVREQGMVLAQALCDTDCLSDKVKALESQLAETRSAFDSLDALYWDSRSRECRHES